jgi:hypothetical protein
VRRSKILLACAFLAVAMLAGGGIWLSMRGNAHGASLHSSGVASGALASVELGGLTPGMRHTLFAIPGGFEGAAWDQRGNITFWKLTGAGPWHKVGQSTYPNLAEARPASPPGTVAGALLTGMSDATFILTGPFSADGQGNALPYTAGPHGWGLLESRSPGTLTVGQGSARSVSTPAAVALGYYFSDGMLVSQESTGAFGLSFGTWFPLDLYWSWAGGHFAFAKSNVITATTVPAPPTSGTPLPSATPPDGT